jgi:hypothetical protein
MEGSRLGRSFLGIGKARLMECAGKQRKGASRRDRPSPSFRLDLSAELLKSAQTAPAAGAGRIELLDIALLGQGLPAGSKVVAVANGMAAADDHAGILRSLRKKRKWLSARSL